MDVEIRTDPAAADRPRRLILQLVSFVIGLPTLTLVAWGLLSTVLDGETAGNYAKCLGLAGFFGYILFGVLTSQRPLRYRCPECGGPTSEVIPQGEAQHNLHYLCPACRVAWDLGWAPSPSEGVGG